MTMNTDVARVRIAREIGAAEEALDFALIKQAQLFTSLVTARQDTKAKPFEGQDALLRLTRSQQSLLSAGGDLARVHGKLLKIDREMGGAGSECPDDWRLPMGSAGQDIAA
jgi:hypothetical protein